MRDSHHRILRAMLAGATLKAHRDLDGAKTHLLHPLDGPAEPVDRAAVEHLVRHGLIASNMKFPAATYVLTERGIAVASGASKQDPCEAYTSEVQITVTTARR